MRSAPKETLAAINEKVFSSERKMLLDAGLPRRERSRYTFIAACLATKYEGGRFVLYNAFLSYSHAADDKLAAAVQHALHSFAKPWHKLRRLRIFRDKTTLAMTPKLWPAFKRR